MSKYDQGYYAAVASRNFEDAMNAAADASLALVNRQQANNSVSMADYMALRKQFNRVVAASDELGDVIQVYKAALKHYIHSGNLASKEKVNADLRNLAAQMGISWDG